jgi:hypothetical protein
VTSSGRKSARLVDDVRKPWEGMDNLVVVDESLTRPLCAEGATVRMERVLIHRSISPAPETGSLNKETLLDALAVHKDIVGILEKRDKLKCVRDADGKCLSISPLLFWDNIDGTTSSSSLEKQLSNLNSTSAHDIIHRINTHRPLSSSGIRITPDMTLAERSITAQLGAKIRYSRFLVMTYFFEEDDCVGESRREVWKEVLATLKSQTVDVRESGHAASLVALQVCRLIVPPHSWI